MKKNGFTLIELLVYLAIGSIVITAIVSGIFQITYGQGRIKGETIALNDIDNASHWLTRDIVMGQSTDLLEGAEPANQIALAWIDFTGGVGNEVSHYVIYTYSETETELQRDYDGVVTTIGRYLTDVGFSLDGHFVTVTLTSSPDTFPRVTVTRTYVIQLRTKEE